MIPWNISDELHGLHAVKMYGLTLYFVVRAHTERYEFGSSLPVTASRFEIGSVTQSSVKTAPQTVF